MVAGDLGQTSGYGSVGVSRLNANGTVDTTFGTGGYFFDSTMFAGYGLAVQPNGEIVLAGRGSGSPAVTNGNGFFVDRILADGSGLDTSFGTSGQVQIDFPNLPVSRAGALAIGPDGKITIAGCVDPLVEFGSDGIYVYSFATARLLNDITSNTTAAVAPTPMRPACVPSATPASVPSGLAFAPLVLDSPDPWSAFRPMTRRHGGQ